MEELFKNLGSQSHRVRNVVINGDKQGCEVGDVLLSECSTKITKMKKKKKKGGF